MCTVSRKSHIGSSLLHVMNLPAAGYFFSNVHCNTVSYFCQQVIVTVTDYFEIVNYPTPAAAMGSPKSTAL